MREAFKGIFVDKLGSKLDFVRNQEIEHEEKMIDWEHTLEKLANDDNMDKSEQDYPDPPVSKYAPKEINTDGSRGKGFAGTSLMLFPNVRYTKIKLGEECA